MWFENKTIMSAAMRYLFAFLLSLWVNSACGNQYQIEFDSKNASIARLTLILDNPLQEETLFVVRKQKQSISAFNVRCDRSGQLEMSGDGSWVAPRGCREILWSVRFQELQEPNFDVSRQSNVYLEERWWLFSEWGSLLRPIATGQRDSEICESSTDFCQKVPAPNQAPLLMLIGKPDIIVAAGGTSFRLYSGFLPSSLDKARLAKDIAEQLRYLSDVIGSHLAPAVIDVLWLGIDEKPGISGGAAGFQSYLSNVVLRDNDVSDLEVLRLRWISGHELAHMVGLTTSVLWASESLAHYYGYKSLQGSQLLLFNDMTSARSEIGILAAHEQVTRYRNYKNYGVFYSKGTRLWKDLDSLIVRSTTERENLDSYLPLLLKGQFNKNGYLPAEFLNTMVGLCGNEEFNRILEAYL